ncbi:type VI secretion system tip protein VgrG, partial [Salmonella enterica]
AFLTRLWSEEGIFYFDWHAPQGAAQKLVLCDDVAGVSTLGEMPFNPNTDTEVSTMCISSLRYRARTGPSSVETQDYTFKTPGWPGYYNRAAENLNGQRTQYEIFDYPGRFKDGTHGEAFARYQMEGWRHDTETATCISNSPELCPGKRFTLTGHPSEALNREWQVVSCVLAGDQPQALHGSGGQGTTLDNHFEAIPADRTWRVPPQPKPSVDGPQSAIVTGPAGEEIFCDEHGRVRVRFHWDRYCPGNEDSSCWVRVSQAWAGAGFGNLAIPRVGQEVIVDFLNGDPDQPIIMGRTYHQDNRSPGSLPGTKTQMTIRSKTYKGDGFNELRFEDATGKEELYMHAQKDMTTEVLHDRTTTVNNNHTETVVVGQTVNVGTKKEDGHDQKITVANDQIVTVINDQTTEVAEGNQKTEIKKGNQHITIYEGEQTIKVKKTIDMGSDEKIVMQCGKSLFSMDKNGIITITGIQIKIKGEKEVDIN